jgi:hypothetical protein
VRAAPRSAPTSASPCLALLGAGGRVVIPILVQQAIDRGFTDDGVQVGVVSVLAAIALVGRFPTGSASPTTAKSGKARWLRASPATSRRSRSSSSGAAWRGCSTAR